MLERLFTGFASAGFMPHGHCYLWIPSLLWLHFWSDMLIGTAYVGISILLYVLVRKIRLPFSPVFIAFGLFIGLCGLTHFMEVWTIWNPDYWIAGFVKAATALASVATAIGLVYVKPRVEEVVHAARLSEERRISLESANAELDALYRKLKQMDELKSQFFANVSHELRTPLALILGPAERLLEDDGLSPAQRRQLEGIRRNGQMLLKQVNDLLDVSRLEAGKLEPEYAGIDAAHWLRLVASRFESAAEGRGIQLRVSAPAELTAEADPDMLERVFINLLSNALKFTPDGGRIDVELKLSGERLILSVADSGPGVRADQREAIFERFRQADGSVTRRHGGTGLGLAIVKDFLSLHGGRIGVRESELGGALFEAELPVRAPAGSQVRQAPTGFGAAAKAALEGSLAAAAPAPAEAPPTGAAPSGAHVLVVEDNDEMRAFIADTLRPRYNVVTAQDGRDGLARARALRPDVIISDVMMPGMSGDQLVAALRADESFATTPILLLTAKADDELRVRLLREGAQDYLNKPFMAAELLARVGNLAGIKRAGDTLRAELASLSTDLEGLARELSQKHRQLQTALDAAEVAREQAERSSRAKSAFLGMVSHELRTPLSTLQMNLQMLARDKNGSLPEELRPRVERLNSAALRLATLVEGLLEYTRVESGGLNLRLEPVDLAALAAEAVEDYQFEAANRGLTLTLGPSPATLPIEGDTRLLKVILSNLIGNALKFTPRGGIVVRVGERGEQRLIEVQDTGVGIPAQDMERIFNPFEQLEPVQRKSVPGIGLGLALVKEMAEALGGRVEVESELGVGSTFRVWIAPPRK